MAKFRKKPIIIEAVQWQPGMDVPGVVLPQLTIHYSRSGEEYYVTGGPSRPTMALSTKQHDGEVPEDQRNPNAFLGPFPVQINHNDGRKWWRHSYPFNCWEIKSGTSKPADPASDEVVDYAVASGWPNLNPSDGAYVQTLEGRMFVSPGDWIITGVKGEKYPCKPDVFAQTYEPADADEGATS